MSTTNGNIPGGAEEKMERRGFFKKLGVALGVGTALVVGGTVKSTREEALSVLNEAAEAPEIDEAAQLATGQRICDKFEQQTGIRIPLEKIDGHLSANLDNAHFTDPKLEKLSQEELAAKMKEAGIGSSIIGGLLGLFVLSKIYTYFRSKPLLKGPDVADTQRAQAELTQSVDTLKQQLQQRNMIGNEPYQIPSISIGVDITPEGLNDLFASVKREDNVYNMVEDAAAALRDLLARRADLTEPAQRDRFKQAVLTALRNSNLVVPEGEIPGANDYRVDPATISTATEQALLGGVSAIFDNQFRALSHDHQHGYSDASNRFILTEQRRMDTIRARMEQPLAVIQTARENLRKNTPIERQVRDALVGQGNGGALTRREVFRRAGTVVAAGGALWLSSSLYDYCESGTDRSGSGALPSGGNPDERLDQIPQGGGNTGENPNTSKPQPDNDNNKPSDNTQTMPPTDKQVEDQDEFDNL